MPDLQVGTTTQVSGIIDTVMNNELIERRKERIDSLRTLADKYAAQTNPTIKAIILEELKEEMISDKPYSMCSKSMFKALLSNI